MFTACRKNDLPANEASEPPIIAAEQKAPDAWKSVSGWNSSASGNTTSFSSRIEDARLSSEVVNNGLVLVYMKKDGKAVSLPFTDAGSKLNWHYQVSDNVLQINGDASGSAEVASEQISYFVIAPEKIKELEAEGTPKIDLMSFTYEKAAAVLK